MAVRRKKINRQTDLTVRENRVIDMPPGWVFTIDCQHHGKIVLDFNEFRVNGREELAAHMRDAVWSQRHELVGMSLDNQRHGIRPFWRFLDSLELAGESVTQPSQVTRSLIDRYLAWLDSQIVVNGTNKSKPWTASAKRRAFAHLKTALTNRQKRCPSAVSADLSFPRNPFPNSNTLTQKRASFSPGEQKRILGALNADLRLMHEPGNTTDLPAAQVLAVHLLLLAMATGRNLQSLLDLKRDSLRSHPLEDRDLLLTTKRRGWSTHATSLRKAVPKEDGGLQTIPSSIGDHFRFLCSYTAALTADATEADREFVFLRRVSKYSRKGQVERLEADGAKSLVTVFVKRHGLVDDRGRRLRLSLARLRPTFGTELYRRTRDIRRVQQALGHASAETTARHYAETPLEAERDHAIVLDGMVARYTRYECKEAGVIVAADGKVPLEDIVSLLDGGYNTGIARCQNPFRENDDVCQKLFHCFKCPNMCVFEDDLWRLFSFYYRLLAERVKINPAHWLKTYGPIIRRIDSDIAPLFPSDKVDAARREAQANPHPTWKGPLL